MCLTVTHPPPGLFFWNWNKDAELFYWIFEMPFKLLCIPDFSLFYPQKDQLLQLHVNWDDI